MSDYANLVLDETRILTNCYQCVGSAVRRHADAAVGVMLGLRTRMSMGHNRGRERRHR